MKQSLLRIIVLLLGLNCSEAVAAIVYVDKTATGLNNGTSWINAYTDLQTALQNAYEGDDVWVTNAIYFPTATNDRNSTFDLRDSINFYGGFLGGETAITQRYEYNRTTLSGNIGSPTDTLDNSIHLCWVSSSDVEMIFDGFVVEDGYAESSSGGAIYTHLGFITFVNCIFRRNYSLWGGAICSTQSSMEYIDCLFEDNWGVWGGAYQCWGGTTDNFYNCDFINNSSSFFGGAVTAQLNTDITFENCRFIGNTAQIGGAIMIKDTGSVTCMNTIINGNEADSGAAVGIIEGSTFFGHNSTIVQNNATFEGGGIFLEDGYVVLHNSIFRDNSSGVGFNNIAGNTSAISTTYCILEEPISGIGNIVAYPLFFDSDGADNIAGNSDDNFHLQLTSPAINVGDTVAMYRDPFDQNNNANSTELFPFDLDGTSRVQGGNIDIGPYETRFFIGIDDPEKSQISAGDVYPNPSNNCQLDLLLKRKDTIRISLYNTNGQLIGLLFEGPLSAGPKSIGLSAEKIAAGFYILQISASNFTVNKKWMIEN